MTGRPAAVRRLSLRLRITLAFVLSAMVLTSLVGAATYYTVRAVLENQRITSSTRQTVFGLLFAREFLGQDSQRAERVVSRLQTREGFDAMVTSGGQWFSTTLSLTPAAVPAELQDLVRGERLGYEMSQIGGDRVLVFGAPLPPASTDLYLFYTMRDVDRTLSLLARVLTVVGLTVVVAAAVIAHRLGRRILHPLGAVSAAAQRVAEGLLETRVRATSRDEVGVLAASFNQMAGALQAMIERERRFVAGVSHELRTPLATLQATSRLLESHREELSPAAREAVDLIVEDVNGLRRLVEELMEMSELDSGRARIRWEEVDLRALVDAVLRKRRLAAVVEGPRVSAVSDKARLERIVGNLLDNAFDHGEGRAVRVAVSAVNGVAEVTVSDQGPGIPPEELGLVFERFHKTDRSRSRERGGVGLGLPIALENARLLGGTIEVSSSVGEGSAFTLRLPHPPVEEDLERSMEGAEP